VRMAVYCIVAGILCLELFFEISTSSSPRTEANSDSHEDFHHFESDTLTNQRNAVLAGTSALLLLILNELCQTSKINMRIQSDIEVMKKQAQGASNEYLKLLEKSDSKDKGSDKSKDSQQSEEIKLKNETKQLRNENRRSPDN